MVIKPFHGKYRFLSNFFPTLLVIDGQLYPTVEHAYQAAKTHDHYERERIRCARSPGDAKRLGRRVTLREDWDEIKDHIMYDILRRKFRNPILAKKLIDTGDAELVEENWWNDTYWGVCRGVGENRLGKLLMQVRDEIRG